MEKWEIPDYPTGFPRGRADWYWPGGTGLTPTFAPKQAPTPRQEESKVDNIGAAIREALVQRKVDAEVTRRLEIIDSYGDDREDGTVLKFNKVLPIKGTAWTPGMVVTAAHFNELVQAAQAAEEGAKAYTYVALRAGGRWYLSGPKQADKPRTWEEFVLWLAADGEPVTELVTMLEATPLAAQAPRALTDAELRPEGGTGERGNSSGNGANDRPRKRRLISTGTLGGVPRNWQLG